MCMLCKSGRVHLPFPQFTGNQQLLVILVLFLGLAIPCCGLQSQQSQITLSVIGILSFAGISTIGWMIIRTWTFHPKGALRPEIIDQIFRLRDLEAETRIMRRKEEIAKKLSNAIQLKTISQTGPDVHSPEAKQAFLDLHKLLEDTFPLVHKNLKKTVISDFSLLFEWEGSNQTRLPYFLYAHMDVVPVSDSDQWGIRDMQTKQLVENIHPFSGKIHEGFVWGRGAIDDKQAVVSILEAVEDLLANGFKPERSVYIGFGHDEEVGGPQGGKNIAKYFKDNNIYLDFMHDEGLMIISNALPMNSHKIAFVCCSEKGSVQLNVEVAATGGHGSSPPNFKKTSNPTSAIGIMSRALMRLELNPFPPHMDSTTRQMFEFASHGFKFPLRFISSNMWFFGFLLKKILGSKQTTATTIQTTTALTIIHGGEKDNVLPTSVKACIDHRVHPCDTIDYVIKRDKEVVKDERVLFSIIRSTPPSPVSSPTNDVFNTISTSVYEWFTNVIVVPSLMIASTDSKHFWEVSKSQYRFCPTTLNMTGEHSVAMFHGTNEKMGIENLARSVLYYRSIILRSDLK